MDLKSFLSPMSAVQREEFARKCQTTKGHLQNVMYGKSCATDLAVHIERESNSLVTRKELREDWANHWPELISAEGPHGATSPPAPKTSKILKLIFSNALASSHSPDSPETQITAST